MAVRRIAKGAGLILVVMGVILASPTFAAQADEPMPQEATETSATTGLILSGYDPVVAEANGYVIVTDDAGAQQSVAISDEAIEFERQLSRQCIFSRTTWVNGPCGNSWINAVSRGNSKFISTGFVVPRPVIAKSWTTQVWGWGGLPSYTWVGPSGSSWSSSWSFSLSGGDFANVLPGSNVVMNNGAVCLSGSPGENFHS